MSRGCGNSNSNLQLGIVQECFDVSSCMVVEKKWWGRKRAMKREKIEEGKVI